MHESLLKDVFEPVKDSSTRNVKRKKFMNRKNYEKLCFHCCDTISTVGDFMRELYSNPAVMIEV